MRRTVSACSYLSYGSTEAITSIAHEQCCSASRVPPFAAMQANTYSARVAVEYSLASLAHPVCAQKAAPSASSMTAWQTTEVISAQIRKQGRRSGPQQAFARL